MAKIIIEGVASVKIAKLFCEWYADQGCKDASASFDDENEEAPIPDYFSGGQLITVDKKNQTVTLKVQ